MTFRAEKPPLTNKQVHESSTVTNNKNKNKLKTGRRYFVDGHTENGKTDRQTD